MQNIKLTLEYDGSRYQGWQRLGKGESQNTVANKLIEVIKKMTGKDVELIAGIRTEVGVHAQRQTAAFKANSQLKEYEIKQYLNRYLPMDIAVTDVEFKPERFHASLNAVSKIYLYRICISDVPSVFTRKYMYHSFKKPDVDLMKQAAQALIGTHDFKKFSTVKRTKSTCKEIIDLDIYSDNEEIQITIQADDFLHNMARMIVSTLLDVGLGTRELKEMDRLLDVQDELIASAPADPKGLILQDVIY